MKTENVDYFTRERDATNVTNDDVFWLVCSADMTHSPWENPRRVLVKSKYFADRNVVYFSFGQFVGNCEFTPSNEF
jgi:hypothetical protein